MTPQPVFLTPFARKAIIDSCQNQITFLREIVKEACTPEFLTGVNAEIKHHQTLIEIYSIPTAKDPVHEQD